MLIALHRNAVTTPRQRAYIRTSPLSVAALARELGVSETTIRRWRNRSDGADRSSRPHRLATSLSAEEEEVAVELRCRLDLSLDDALAVLHRCVRPDISRSALYRLWRRRGIAAPPPPDTAQARAAARFEPAPFGYVHVDLKHLTRLEKRPAYVFVAIERATRFAHIDILADRSAATVAAALTRFLAAFGQPVHTILTDNGSEFTDRFGGAFYTSRQTGTGRHAFDRVCAAHAIIHKLTRPYHPQTNGMVERFNRRIGEALASRAATGANAGRNRFTSHDERNAFLYDVVARYNRTRLQCLGYTAPAEQLANLTKQYTCAGTLGKRLQCSRDVAV